MVAEPSDVTPMPAEQFDELVASLDEPDEAPVLREAARRRRAYREST
ncbi:hypothetical protein [Streptosporangium sp. NPDC001681]